VRLREAPEEVVDHEALVAVPDGVEVDVVVVVAEEEEREPGLECVHRHDEEDPHDPPLLRGVGVVPGVSSQLVQHHNCLTLYTCTLY